jgi:hypothetical protein
MADKTVIIKLDVQEAGAEAQIVSLNNKLSKLTEGSKEYELVVKKIAIQEDRLSKIQSKRTAIQGESIQATKATVLAHKNSEKAIQLEIARLNSLRFTMDTASKGYVEMGNKVSLLQQKLQTAKKGVNGFATSTKDSINVLNKQNDATGSATAATMELSRVVSDAPYGIRGMANNITQLVSQLGSASKKAGGLGGALKLMGKQLMGPLGIVFLITAAVSALDYFYGAATKADKSINSVAESAAKSASALKILVKANDSGTMSTEETAKAVKKANSEYKDLNIQVGKNGKITDESVLAINRKITSLENLARATALQGLVEEKFAKLIPLENKLKTQEEEALVKLRIKGINSIKEAQAIADDKKFTAEKGYVTGVLNQANFTKSKIDGIKRDIDELIETIPNIDDLFKGEEDKKINREKVDVLGLDSVDIGENKKKMKKVLDAVADAVGVDLKKDPLKIDTNIDLELSDEAKKIIADKLKSDLDNLMLDSKLEDAKDFVDKSKEILGAMTDFANAEFDRELTIEQNKTNALNTELNNRLNNENLSKEQRASIQLQIAQNDEKLRVKQDAIEKKKFKMNKAARIANALMDTASAAIGVMADSKGGFLARLANALPTIAFGLAQVATISRQKFQSSASKTPISTTSSGGSGVGGSSERPEASFNIVGGRTKEDALLGAIQAKFDQPIKAYVVSGDVTNQQQLDRVIVSSSSL